MMKGKNRYLKFRKLFPKNSKFESGGSGLPEITGVIHVLRYIILNHLGTVVAYTILVLIEQQQYS